MQLTRFSGVSRVGWTLTTLAVARCSEQCAPVLWTYSELTSCEQADHAPKRTVLSIAVLGTYQCEMRGSDAMLGGVKAVAAALHKSRRTEIQDPADSTGAHMAHPDIPPLAAGRVLSEDIAADSAGVPEEENDTMTDHTLNAVFEPDEYLHFYSVRLTPERNAQDTARVERLLGLSVGARILDLACGHGRVANGLAAMGFEVTGLDRSEAFVRLAQIDAEARGVAPHYVVGDYRALPAAWSYQFDAVLFWDHSFGYFTAVENASTLRQVARVLRPGGEVLIEMPNILLQLNRSLHPVNKVVHGDDFMLDAWTYDPVTGRVCVERDLVRAGQPPRHVTFSASLYTFPELRSLLEQAGFREIQVSDPECNRFVVDSDRMVVRARVAG